MRCNISAVFAAGTLELSFEKHVPLIEYGFGRVWLKSGFGLGTVPFSRFGPDMLLDRSVGGNVIKPTPHTMFNVTA